MTEVKGFTKAALIINPEEHDIRHTLGDGATLTGGKLHFKGGLHIIGEVSDCEELSCDGTLVIAASAKVQAKLVKANCLINLGELSGECINVPGTLVAWSGKINVANMEYAALEKSAACIVKGNLNQIEVKPVLTPVTVLQTTSNPFVKPSRTVDQDDVVGVFRSVN